MDPEFPKPVPQKWYFKIKILVIALLIAGPLALPLLWFNPRIKKSHKIIWTIILLVFTYYSFIVTQKSVNSLMEYYKLVGEIAKP